MIKSKSTTTCKNIENVDESLTFVNSKTTPVIKATSDTSCDMRKSPTALEVDILRANMMAIKSFFMNKTYDLRQVTSSLQLKLQPEKLNQSGYNNICEKDEKIIIEDLKTKLDFYQRENQLLKDETMAKQRTIETILYQNNKLLKLDQYYNKNIEQEIIVSKAEEKVQKLNKISQESKKQIIGVVDETGKGIKRKNTDQIIPHNPKNNLVINPQIEKIRKRFLLLVTRLLKTLLAPESQEQIPLR